MIPVPGFALKTVLGEFGDVLALSSIRIDSSKLLDSGYKFRFDNLEDCFRHLLGKRAGGTPMRDIVVIGAGYGGLVASALLAKEGHNVTL